MDVLGSECSSGCESGWTLYLEQSFLPPNATHRSTQFVDAKAGFSKKGKSIAQEEDEEDEEEDLSMVSDASSGPPQFQEDESYFNFANGCMYPPFKGAALVSNGGKRLKVVKEHRSGKDQELPAFLDDTASSPAFNFSKDSLGLINKQSSLESNLEYSQGFSATYFEGRSAYQENFGYIQPSFTGNQFQNNQWF